MNCFSEGKVDTSYPGSLIELSCCCCCVGATWLVKQSLHMLIFHCPILSLIFCSFFVQIYIYVRGISFRRSRTYQSFEKTRSSLSLGTYVATLREQACVVDCLYKLAK